MSISCQQEHFSSKYTSKRSSQGKQCCAVIKINLKLFDDNYCGSFLVLYGIGGDRGNGYRGPCPLGVRTQDFTMEGSKGRIQEFSKKGRARECGQQKSPGGVQGPTNGTQKKGQSQHSFLYMHIVRKIYGDALGVHGLNLPYLPFGYASTIPIFSGFKN